DLSSHKKPCAHTGTHPWSARSPIRAHLADRGGSAHAFDCWAQFSPRCGPAVARATDSARLTYALRAKRRAAAASAAGARVVEAKAGVVQALDVVERGPRDIGQRDFIDEHLHAIEYCQGVAVLAIVEAERILETGASAADHGNAESLLGAQPFFL